MGPDLDRRISGNPFFSSLGLVDMDDSLWDRCHCDLLRLLESISYRQSSQGPCFRKDWMADLFVLELVVCLYIYLAFYSKTWPWNTAKRIYMHRNNVRLYSHRSLV